MCNGYPVPTIRRMSAFLVRTCRGENANIGTRYWQSTATRVVAAIAVSLAAIFGTRASLAMADVIRIEPTVCYGLDSTLQTVTASDVLNVRSGNYLADGVTPDDAQMFMRFDIPTGFTATAARLVVSGKVITPDFPGNFLLVYTLSPTALPASYEDRPPTFPFSNDNWVGMLNQLDYNLSCFEWEIYDVDLEPALPDINGGVLALQIANGPDATVGVLDDTLIATSTYADPSQRPYLELTNAVPEPGSAAFLGGVVAVAVAVYARKKWRT